ncbi:MAG: glycosyl hydrolase [Chitinophagaceae bacterium]
MNVLQKWLFSIILLSLLIPAHAQEPVNRHSFAYIQQQFASPDKQFGSAPLWVWNTRVTKAIIDSMLTGFKQQAFGGVFVHPRPGLETPYLSTEWFTLWKYAMQKAKQLGLDIWIYDENSYPSGFAGGHVPAAMPSSYNQGQMLYRLGATVLPDSSQYFIAIEKQNDGSYKLVTDKTSGRQGNFTLFKKEYYYKSPWYGNYSYVDLMVPGVTEKFIDVSFRKGYAPYVGSEFGKTVKGIFSDEPNIESQDNKSTRWTPLLFETFKKKWGYSLEEHLPSLFEETGDWKKTRHHYYSVLLDLFIEYWSKPMNKYTTENNLEWTGHYWEHEWPSLRSGPDNMAMYAWHQRPGIDMLFNQFDEYSNNAQFGNIRSVKELASVANQLGKKRTLSETYGGGGWELTFKDMKRLGDWEYVLGINTLNQHLAFMTLQGARKYDYPQSFSYHNPWWPYYAGLNKHFARLSLALSTGKQKNDILVLEPTTTAWMNYRYIDSIRLADNTGQLFQSFITRMEKAQVEYDLGSEDIIQRNGKVNGSSFIVGEAAYKTVVVPASMKNINDATFKLLQQFTANGGHVLLFDTLQYLNGERDKELENFVQSQSRFNGIDALDEAFIKKHLGNDDIRFDKTDTASTKLYHQRRQLADGQIILLVNSSISNAVKGSFYTKGFSVNELKTQTGNISSYSFAIASNEIRVDYDLPAAGSLLLFISNKKATSNNAISNTLNKAGGTEVSSSATVISRLRPNVLTLDFCDLKTKDSLLSRQYFYTAADYLYKKNGFNDGDPWNTSVQYNDETIRRDTFKAGTGFEVSYHFIIDSKPNSSMQLKAVIERNKLWQLSINGKSLAAIAGQWWLDHDFAVFDINNYVHEGENTLQLVAPKMSVYAEIQPVYITGNFNLAPDAAAWHIAPAQPLQLGSWKEQGMPLYGHEVVYKKTFTVSNPQKKYFIEPGIWKGTVALLKVNNQQVAILLGNEIRFDISKYVKKGSNDVSLIITGSLKNTLGPHYNKPATGLVSPWHWRYVTKPLAGKDYDLYDYGLMEDFKVITE